MRSDPEFSGSLCFWRARLLAYVRNFCFCRSKAADAVTIVRMCFSIRAEFFMPTSGAACNIIVDSCCELSRGYCERAGLRVLNFSYTETVKGDDGLTGVDDMYESTSAHDFYEAMRHGAQPMTSQPSQLAFETAFNEAIDSGVPTVYLAFSSGLSGAYEGACTALARICREREVESAAELGMYVVDLKLGSTPQGLIIAEAVRQRDRGLTAAELAAWAAEARYYVQTMFMVDDLDALHRGGRIPAGVALVGGKLDVKPLLTFDTDGKLAVVGVVRGRKKGLRRMAEFYSKGRNADLYSNVAAIGNADATGDARRLRELIAKQDDTTMFLETNIGPTIGCHVGPGMVSVSFWGEDRRGQTSISDRIAGMVKGK